MAPVTPPPPLSPRHSAPTYNLSVGLCLKVRRKIENLLTFTLLVLVSRTKKHGCSRQQTIARDNPIRPPLPQTPTKQPPPRLPKRREPSTPIITYTRPPQPRNERYLSVGLLPLLPKVRRNPHPTSIIGIINKVTSKWLS